MDFKGFFALFFIILVALGFLIYLICDLVVCIKEKRLKKWRAKCLSDHPVLEVLIFNYKHDTEVLNETAREMRDLKKRIDEWTEQSKYLPRQHLIHESIEVLKERYFHLSELCERQKEDKKVSEKALRTFWELNYPEVDESKWIMWLD